LSVSADDGAAVIRPSGSWVVARIVEADALVRDLPTPAGGRVRIDLGAVDQIDTSGVMVLVRLRKRLELEGRSVDIVGATETQLPLFEAILPLDVSPRPHSEKLPSLIRVMENLGRDIATQFAEYGGAVDFLGRTVQALARAPFSPRRLRITSVFHHMKVAGFDAVAINCLLTFLIGAVVAFLCIDMLELFGAGALTVNIMGFALLRELGVLLVAIVAAGRSGSAFTAQIGSMRTREEIDAMRTLGLDPIEMLVLPRVIAMVLVLPLLVFLGDLFGLIGGAMACFVSLDMSGPAFWGALQQNIEVRHFWVGIIKAPVFAFLISMIGCYQGFLVEGSAESLGGRTTESVVHSIFAVIVADAFFAIYFMSIDF
jgi:phospholipid/cholesterol/gamma-HCH transport system permease protein